MANIIPPPPADFSPQNQWSWINFYRDVREAINNATNVTWANLDFTGSNITDIVTRLHNSLQSIQGGTAGEYYHLTSAQYTSVISLPTIASGTYTPTLVNVANLDASTAYQGQYTRVGSVVTVSGRVDIDPTLAATTTQLGISLPIVSNIGATEDCAGTAAASGVVSQVAAIRGDAANNRAELIFISSDVTNQPMYFTFTYEVI